MNAARSIPDPAHDAGIPQLGVLLLRTRIAVASARAGGVRVGGGLGGDVRRGPRSTGAGRRAHGSLPLRGDVAEPRRSVARSAPAWRRATGRSDDQAQHRHHVGTSGMDSSPAARPPRPAPRAVSARPSGGVGVTSHQPPRPSAVYRRQERAGSGRPPIPFGDNDVQHAARTCRRGISGRGSSSRTRTERGGLHRHGVGQMQSLGRNCASWCAAPGRRRGASAAGSRW